MARLVRITWLLVLVTGLYSGWVIWRRHSAQRAPARAAAADPLAKYGNAVEIVQFYAGAGTIAKGQKGLLCYSVVNATGVRLDPPVESVWPSFSRCFQVEPTRNTRYILTAEGADHKTVSQTVDLVVKP